MDPYERNISKAVRDFIAEKEKEIGRESLDQVGLFRTLGDGTVRIRRQDGAEIRVSFVYFNAVQETTEKICSTCTTGTLRLTLRHLPYLGVICENCGAVFLIDPGDLPEVYEHGTH